jgi:hypothetical protein
MRFVLLTYVGEQGVARWDAMSSDQRQAYVDEHVAWFRKHGEKIAGGEELGSPRSARTIRRARGRVTVSDGPFIESKELLGGFIIVDVDDQAEAEAMAREWPALGTDGNYVEVWPIGSSQSQV